MKGIVFTDFVEFLERELPESVGGIVKSYSPLESYPDEELLALVARAGQVATVPSPEILRRFGAHLFQTLATLYPVFVDGVRSPLELLSGIETTVHGEVQKLYPDAVFPRFEVGGRAAGRLELVYRSHRPLADLAEGMIRGCIAWFGDDVEVERRDLGDGDGRAARFMLRAAPRGARSRHTAA